MSNTTFPTSFDSPTNPAGGSALTSPDHALQHGFANDAIKAIEKKIGTGSSAQVATASSFFYGSAASVSQWIPAGYGLNVPTSAAVSLNHLEGTLGTDVSLGVNTPTTVMTTGTLAVGTWLFDFSGVFIAGDNNAGFLASLVGGTATYSKSGAWRTAGGGLTTGNVEVQISLHCTVTVTVAGNIIIQGVCSSGSGGTAKAEDPSYLQTPVTGYRAVQIA